ncbi:MULTISPECIES: 2-aminoethylphosphonate--pyruvate transaminase [Bacillus]|uniref:2-aminoethylphosphonate--pyruvate transaminase n=1 Tax=Bacillus TaxID=1386 RepID=UPI000313B882|nr:MULTISPECIES: 2-aminoethylphosphonate--pyruvate transaminase [Bacillus]
MFNQDQESNPYLLLTPGPLTTYQTVKNVMMKDWCTWDNDYNQLVQKIRRRLVSLATSQIDQYSAVLMQGSGTFTVESVIGSVIPKEGKLVVLVNGVYGARIAQIAQMLHIETIILNSGETSQPNLDELECVLKNNPEVTHVAVVHCETTTGMINPIAEIGAVVNQYNKVYIVDAMSSFGGIPIDVSEIGIDYLISSANKCIQGVPGFGFVIAKIATFHTCKGYARSLSLDLYDQWETMEKQNGKWRFTSPTHVVRAFDQALIELENEGGIMQRNKRYCHNQRLLVDGMRALGYDTLLDDHLQSPIITSFHYPKQGNFSFQSLYQSLKEKGYVIYPGKVTNFDTFRIGNIGEVYEKDIFGLLQAIKESTLVLTRC